MSNANVSRLGSVNQANASDTLFLKVFSGEVLNSYNTNNVMRERVRTRKISSGKSAQFPAIGKIAAQYHTPGAEILGSDVNHNEVVITIDQMLISSAFVANIDEAMNHYDVRSEYSKQMGQALAKTFDRQLLSMAVKGTVTGATKAANVADGFAGTYHASGAEGSAAQVTDALFAAAAKFDEQDIPTEGRYTVVAPDLYYKLVAEAGDVLNRDFSSNNGDVAGGTIMKIAGFEIVKSNNLSVNHASSTSGFPKSASDKYEVDATNCLAMCLHRDSLGIVQLMDMATESQYDMRRQGTLMVSKMAVGAGILRPESIFGIWKAAAS